MEAAPRKPMIKDALLAEYDHEVATTRKLIERLPDDKLAWTPHVKSMSLGGLASHLANLPLWTGNVLNEASFDIENATRSVEKRRAPGSAAFDENTSRARGWMDKTDAERGALGQPRRPRNALDAPHRRDSQLRHQPSHSPSRPVERLPASQRHPGPPIYGPSADEGCELRCRGSNPSTHSSFLILNS